MWHLMSQLTIPSYLKLDTSNSSIPQYNMVQVGITHAHIFWNGSNQFFHTRHSSQSLPKAHIPMCPYLRHAIFLRAHLLLINIGSIGKVASGNLLQFAIEHGPVEIVDLPIENGGFFIAM